MPLRVLKACGFTGALGCRAQGRTDIIEATHRPALEGLRTNTDKAFRRRKQPYLRRPLHQQPIRFCRTTTYKKHTRSTRTSRQIAEGSTAESGVE